MTATAAAHPPGTTDPPASGQSSSYLESASVGVRVAGVVIALAYLVGALDGPLLAVAGGLALVTYGHVLMVDRKRALLVGTSFAVIVVALAAGALRWSTLDLSELRGIQAVLGPTVLVERTGFDVPLLAPVAGWTAAAACLLALSVWLTFPRGEAWFSLIPWAIETIVGALAVATVFWGPAGEGGGDLVRWALVTLAVAVPAAGLSFLLTRISNLWTTVVLVVAATAALTAVGVSAALVAV